MKMKLNISLWNWQEEIYMTDPDGNNKQVLLSLNKNNTILCHFILVI